MKITFIIKSIMDRLPLKDIIKNFNKEYGLFNKFIHLRNDGEKRIRYKSKTGAEIICKKMNDRHHVEFVTYYCSVCGNFHIYKK